MYTAVLRLNVLKAHLGSFQNKNDRFVVKKGFWKHTPNKTALTLMPTPLLLYSLERSKLSRQTISFKKVPTWSLEVPSKDGSIPVGQLFLDVEFSALIDAGRSLQNKPSQKQTLSSPGKSSYQWKAIC